MWTWGERLTGPSLFDWHAGRLVQSRRGTVLKSFSRADFNDLSILWI